LPNADTASMIASLGGFAARRPSLPVDAPQSQPLSGTGLRSRADARLVLDAPQRPSQPSQS